MFERHWSELRNGDLLEVAEGVFDVLVTTDQTLRYQENLNDKRIGIIVFMTTSWPRNREQTSLVMEAIARISPGDHIEIDFS